MAEDINYHSFSDARENQDVSRPREASSNQPDNYSVRLRVGDLETVEVFHGDREHQGDTVDVPDDALSIDENYDIQSLTSSIEDQLT